MRIIVAAFLAGAPAHVVLGSLMLFVTTLFAPIATSSAMIILPKMTAPAPMKQLSPMVGASGVPLVAPMVTP